MNKRNRSIRTRMVPALIGGKKVSIDPNSVPEWQKHSGETHAGATVASLKTAEVGDSILIRSGSAVLSASQDEFEVLATQYLQGKGFQVTATA